MWEIVRIFYQVHGEEYCPYRPANEGDDEQRFSAKSEWEKKIGVTFAGIFWHFPPYLSDRAPAKTATNIPGTESA